MKVKEQSGAKKGGYVAHFKEIIRSGNKLALMKTKDGKQRLGYRLISEDGKQTIPCGIAFEPDGIWFESMLGVLGIGKYLDKLRSLIAAGKIEVALEKIESLAREKELDVSVYVREDGGWGSAIRPTNGKFTVQFVGIASRDEKTKEPIYKVINEDVNRGGKKWHVDKNEFEALFQIVSGERKGTVLKHRMNYVIVKDENDDWLLDSDMLAGNEFRNLLVAHRIPVKKLDPDREFENPENGLPELEKAMLARIKKTPVQMKITVVDGWTRKLEPVSISSEDSDGGDKEVESKEEYASELVGRRLFPLIDECVKEESGKSAWQSTGELSKAGKAWVTENLLPLVKKKGMPNSFKKLDDEQTKILIKHIRSLNGS